MCYRCYENDPKPTDFMMSVYAKVDADLPAGATGAAVVDATSAAFRAAGAPSGAEVEGDIAGPGVRTLIRTAKRSGVVINSERCSPDDARRVLRAVAAGKLVAEAPTA